MKTGTRLNKVAVLTGGFAFALMAGLSTVNANDQFTTEVESQNSRTKQDYYSQIGQGSPRALRQPVPFLCSLQRPSMMPPAMLRMLSM